jgi:hypothetical protein
VTQRKKIIEITKGAVIAEGWKGKLEQKEARKKCEPFP